jgi:hypothetical protein
MMPMFRPLVGGTSASMTGVDLSWCSSGDNGIKDVDEAEVAEI